MSCAKTELCIFDSALPQVVVDSTSFEEIYPINALEGSSDIQFTIVGSNTDYLDLNDTLLSVSVKVTDEDGKALADNADVVPSNYFFHTLFKDVILTMNNEVIEGGNNVYAQKALIETILNYGNDTKEVYLDSIGYEDSAETRKGWIAKSKVFQMCGSLQLDFFDQPKYLIPGVSVSLRLKRNESKFCLKSAQKPKLQITEARLYVRRVKVEQSVLMGHEIGLNKQNAHYPIRKCLLVSYTMATGTQNFYKDQIFGDERLPKFVLVTFQTAAQKNGDYGSDSSTFKNFSASSVTLSRTSDYRECYLQNFDTNQYITSYVQSIIRNLGHLDKNINCGITPDLFKSDYPFFTFVLAPDFDTFTTQLPKQGNLRLDVKFDNALDKPGVVHVYGVFDSEIQINKNRTIIQ